MKDKNNESRSNDRICQKYFAKAKRKKKYEKHTQNEWQEMSRNSVCVQLLDVI